MGRAPLTRFGSFRNIALARSSVRVELSRQGRLPVKFTRKEFKQNLQPVSTSPGLRASRREILSPEDIELRQCKLGELICLAAVSNPDICGRLARMASRVVSLQRSDVYSTNDLVKTVQVWQ